MAHVTELLNSTWTAADLVERFGAIPLSRVRLDPPPGSATERDVVEIHDREGRLYELVEGVLLEKDMSELLNSTWTAADLVERFGAIPLSRVRLDPPPGSATERDVVEIHDREDRLYELVDGVLLEKAVGTYESYLAGLLVHLLWAFVRERKLGIVLGADGMTKLAPELVRIPDVSFFSWQRLPERTVPRQAIVHVAPDLAVEVISKGNTREEMQRKLGDYFAAGVRQVWYVYPARREVMVYRSVEEFAVVSAPAILDGSDILPGFRLDLAEYFAEPGNQAPSPPPAANG